MKYYVDGKKISKKEAEKIEKENQRIFKGVDMGLLEFSELLEIQFITKIA